MRKYDIAIIGSGVGGFASASALIEAKKTVVMIEEDVWGGTCPNHGCDPKKILLSGAETIEQNIQLKGKGITEVPSINWGQLMEFKRSFTNPFPDNFKTNAEDLGIDTIKGTATFLNKNQIQVNDEIIEANNFIIATGQRPSLLNIEGKEYMNTSTDFLELDELPKSMVFLGAGYITFELASIANLAGSDVTIIHHNHRPLKGFDENYVSDLVSSMKDKGIHFAFDVDIKKVSKEDDKYTLSGNDYSLQTDYVVCAAGRVPNIEDLNLEKANVTYDKRGVQVNEFMQTSNPSIYACGDVVIKKQPKLTPVASFEGSYVASKILDDTTKAINYPAITTIVYSSPKLAKVGIDISEAKEQPDKYSINEIDMTSWFTYRRMNEPIAKATLIFENKKLVGAYTLSNQADTLINYLTILIDKKITKEDIQQMILGSPTVASDLLHLF